MSLKMLDEKLFAIKFSSNMIFLVRHDFFFFFHFCVLLNRSNISSNMNRFNKAVRKFLNIHRGKSLHQSLILNKFANLQPDTLLKRTPVQLFTRNVRNIIKNIFQVKLLWLTASTQSSSWNLKKKNYFNVFSTRLSFFNGILMQRVLQKYQKQTSRVRGVLPNSFSYKILEKEFIFSRAVGVQS